ncbi:HAUS augmin-like complex subunit 3 [Sardina pilchardus]|uniref:HAUS augmin-like complex subunit 3 n=1 Tax=Sardina pilchardus TaxID=27697 RepID=UPI002E1450C4
MMNGARFLEILAHLGYPEASSLNPSDFDNIFDGTPENKDFMQFLSSLSSQNVLSEEEYQAYHALQASGKPILSEQILEEMELLKGPAGSVEEDEENDEEDELKGKSLEQLQMELEELRRHQRLRQKRLHQLQGLRLARDDHTSAVTSYAQSQSQSEGDEGGDTVKAIARENMATNAALQDLREEVERLQRLTLTNEDEAERQEQEQIMLDPNAMLSAALLSQLPLEPYLHKFNLTHQRIMDHYKARSTLLEEKQGVEKKMEDEDEEDEAEAQHLHTRNEMAKLQAAHMLLQGQLLQARAEEAGASTAKEWLSQQRHSNVKLSAPDSDGGPAVAKERVCSALWRRTQQLCAGVLRGHTAEQGELAAQHARLQERLLGELLRQKAQLDLLQSALQQEQRGHTRAAAHTRSLALGLGEEAARAAERSRGLERLQEEAPQADPILSSTDPTVKRLLQVYEALEKTDSWLAGAADIATVASERQVELQQLAEAQREGVSERLQLVSGLERDGRRLEQWLDPPQGAAASASPVAASSSSQLCPSAQELTQLVRELEQQCGALYRQLQEVTAERSSKCTKAERSATLRRERELYTLFHLDPAALVRVVEDQENRE